MAPEASVTIGQLDGAPEYLFSTVRDALLLGDGRIVVADSDALRISVFRRDGLLDVAFGGPGQGPGEFRDIRRIWTAGSDTLGAWDPRSQRITRYLTDGTLVRSDAVKFGRSGPPLVSGTLDMFLGAFDDGSVALGWLSADLSQLSLGSLSPDRIVFGLFNEYGEFRRVFGEGSGMRRTMYTFGTGPFVFSPYAHSVVVADSLVFTSGLERQVSLWNPTSDGGPARVVSLPGTRIALRSAWQDLENVKDAYELNTFNRNAIAETDRSLGQVPYYSRLLSDEAGRLWLKEYDPSVDAVPFFGGPLLAPGGTWIVVTPDGTIVARANVPNDVAIIRVYSDEIVGLTRDAFDVERVVVHRILR